jgi:hypothetical protein
MSKETVLTAVRDLILGWTPSAANLTQLTRGYAYPYDQVPDPLPEFPVLLVERNRAKSAFSNAVGSAPIGGVCREELLPIRVDVAWQVWDQDKPNVNRTAELAVLAWEDELHALFAANPKIGGAVVKLGEIGAPRRVESKVGLRFWFDEELLVAAAFIDALYEVTV